MSVSIEGPRPINENGGTLWKGQEKSKYQQCECCPYGYHIDLDFVRYCEAVSQRNEASVSKERRKERRRQRQSMEVLLGLTSPSIWNLEQQLPKIAQEISATPEEDLVVQNTSAVVGDALHKAVQDFEDTLERTHVKPPGYLILDPPDVFLDGRGVDLLRGSADDASLSSMSSPVTPQEMVPMSSSAAHEAMLQDFDVASIGSAASGLSHGALQNIRHQMAVSLERMRELEEQVKLIPILQVQLSVAKEEKRKIGLLVSSRDAATEPHHVTTTRTEEQVLVASSPREARVSQMERDRPTHQFESAVTEDYSRINATESDLLVKSPKTARKNQNSTNNGFVMGQYYINSTSKLPMRDVGLTCSVIKRDIDTMHKPIVRHACTSTDDMKNHLNSRDTNGLQSSDSDVNCLKKDTPSAQLQRNSSFNQSKESHVTLPKDVQSSYSVSLSTMDQKTPNRLTQMSKIATRDVKTGSNQPIEKMYTMEQVKKMVAESLQEYKEKLKCEIKTVQREEMAIQVDLPATASASAIIEAVSKPLQITEHRDFSCQMSSGQWARDAYVQATVEAKHYSEQGVQVKPRNKTVLVDATVKTRDYGTQKPFDCPKCTVEKRSFGAGSADIREYPQELPEKTSAMMTRSIGCNTINLIGSESSQPAFLSAIKKRNIDASTATIDKKLVDVGVGTVVRIEVPNDEPCKECVRKDKLLNTSSDKNEDLDKSNTDQESRIPRRTPASAESRPFKRQITYTKISPPKIVDLQEITKTNTSLQDRLKTLPSPPHSRLSEPAECPAEKLLQQSSTLHDKEEENAAAKTSPYKFTPLNENPTSNVKTFNLFKPSVLTSQAQPVATERPLHSPSSSITKNPVELSKKQETKVEDAPERFINSDETSELADVLDISSENRTKAKPSKKMQAALKVVNDSLKKSSGGVVTVGKAANDIIQREWFQISSMPNANPHTVEDYLDAIDEISSPLLEHVVNITDKAGNTAMHYALSQGNFDIVSILLDSKVCNINRPNAAGYTAVMLVSLAQVRSQTHRRVLQRFLADADVNIRAKQHGQTALMLAVSHNRLDMVQLLIEGGADLNIQDEDGSTALMCAAEHGHAAIVQFLINQPDADQSIKDVDGSTALDIALDAGHKDVGILLYAHKHFSRNNSPHSSLRARRSKSGTPTVRSASTPPPPISPSPVRDKPAHE